MTAILLMSPLVEGLQDASWSGLSTGFMASLACERYTPSEYIYIDSAKAGQLSQPIEMSKTARIDFAQLQYPTSAVFFRLGHEGGCGFQIDIPLAEGNEPAGNQTDECYYGG